MQKKVIFCEPAVHFGLTPPLAKSEPPYQGLHNVSPPKWLKNSVEIIEGWIKLQSVLKSFKGVNQNDKLKQYVKTFIFP